MDTSYSTKPRLVGFCPVLTLNLMVLIHFPHEFQSKSFFFFFIALCYIKIKKNLPHTGLLDTA